MSTDRTVRLATATLLLAALTACGDDAPAKVDSEDYAGAPQAVADKRVDPEVTDLKCTKKDKKHRCVSWKPVVTDDRDWVLVLADGTNVDVDEAEFNRYQKGQTYP